MRDLTLGEKARDRVSGWTGTLTARYEYLNGCVRYEIGAADKDGKPETFVFDEQQIEMLPTEPVAVEPARRTGGERSSRPVGRA